MLRFDGLMAASMLLLLICLAAAMPAGRAQPAADLLGCLQDAGLRDKVVAPEDSAWLAATT